MRYGIFSDVHSNLAALEAVMDAYRDEGIDRYLCAGDVVGYGAAPNECCAVVSSISAVTIAGNHDWASVDLFPFDFFNSAAGAAITWTKGRLDDSGRKFLSSLQLLYRDEFLTLAHGTLHDAGEFNYMMDVEDASSTFAILGTPACFVGHTHLPGIFVQDATGKTEYRQIERCDIEETKRYIINVGSVGQPRDNNPAASFCIYDTDKKTVWIKRRSYDVEAARQKIISSGLPRFLGDRLLAGR